MKKSVYALFLILICCVFVFGGCSSRFDERYYETNAFRLCRKMDEDGKISITYTFPVNSKQLLNLGCDAEDVKSYKFYLATYIAAIANSNKEKLLPGMSVTPVSFYKDVDSIGFSLVFDSLDVQNNFFSGGQTNEESSNSSAIKTSGFLVKKVEVETNFPFSLSAAQDVKTVCNLALNLWTANSDIPNATEIAKVLDDSIFIYDFSSCEKSLKSKNYFVLSNTYHNVFIKTHSELAENDKIVFYQVVPNVAFWYFLALIFTILGMIVAYFIKTKQKNQ